MSNVSRISGTREVVAPEVLVVDADPSVPKGLSPLLAPAGLHVTGATSAEQALDLAGHKFFGVVVVDIDSPTPNAGIALIKRLRQASPLSTVIALSPRKSFDAAVGALRAGAHDIIMKAPDQAEYLRERIAEAASQVVGKSRGNQALIDAKEVLEEFLKRFMEAERKLTDLEDEASGRHSRTSEVQEDIRVLVADGDDRLFKALTASKDLQGFAFSYAQSGGEALDRAGQGRFHIALVGQSLVDLPATMVQKTIKAQNEAPIVVSYTPNGPLEVIETSQTIPLVEKFTALTQLTTHLGELAQAHRAKERERRYFAAFRDKHFDLLRRLAELRKRIDRALGD